MQKRPKASLLVKNILLVVQKNEGFSGCQRGEGFSGCNRFKGQYEIINSRLEVGPLASTRKYCSKVIMNQEHLLLNELSKSLLLSQKDNRVIQLINNKGEVTRLMMQ